MSTRYDKHPVDERGWTPWLSPQRKGYKLRCCDCKLVHEVDFRLVGRARKVIQFRARRDNRATAASRRKH